VFDKGDKGRFSKPRMQKRTCVLGKKALVLGRRNSRHIEKNSRSVGVPPGPGLENTALRKGYL